MKQPTSLWWIVRWSKIETLQPNTKTPWFLRHILWFAVADNYRFLSVLICENFNKFWSAAHDWCGRKFHYTTAQPICQAFCVRHFQQFFIPKFVQFDYWQCPVGMVYLYHQMKEVIHMATIAILAILALAGFAGVQCVGGYMVYRQTHDWHFLVGSILYGVACIGLVRFVFNMGW